MPLLKDKKEVWGYLLLIPLILVWAYAAYDKVMHFDSLIANLVKSPLVLGHYYIIAYGLICLEVITWIALVFYGEFLFSRLMSLGLIVSFTIYYLLFSTYGSGQCACGKLFNELSHGEHLSLNFSLIAINLIAVKQKLKFSRKNSSVENQEPLLMK